MNYETRCPGCDDREVNTIEDCCNLKIDSDGLPSRCVGTWSGEKLYYLTRYSKIFNSGMKNLWPNRVFVDLFAGPGRSRVRPTGEFIDGSPLIALQESFTHYFFLDISPRCISALEKRVFAQRASDSKSIKIMLGDVNQSIDDLIKELESLGSGTLGFAFVDPPGIQLEFDSLKKLALNTRIDLLINFPLGMNIKRQLWHQLQKDPQAECEFDKYFGTSEWRELYDTGNTGATSIGYRLLSLYEQQLASIGYRYVGDEHSVRNRGISLYMLVFASKNPRGKDFWEKVTQTNPSGQRRLL